MSGRFALGLGVLWLGYTTFYYGLTQVQSGNYGFLDLALPSRTSRLNDIARDGVDSTSPGVVSSVESRAGSSLLKSVYDTLVNPFSGL